MNNKNLNREFEKYQRARMSSEKLSDSDNEKSLKSPKSNRSPNLSARSPRDEELSMSATQKRNIQGMFRKPSSTEKKTNWLNNDDSDEDISRSSHTSSSALRQNRFQKQDKAASKSQNNSSDLDRSRSGSSSSRHRSGERDEFDMFKTIRQPLNTDFNKMNDLQKHKVRAGTPTKPSGGLNSTTRGGVGHSYLSQQQRSKLDQNLEEEDSEISRRSSARSGFNTAHSPRLNSNDNDDIFRKTMVGPSQHYPQQKQTRTLQEVPSSPKPTTSMRKSSRSPMDSLEFNDDDFQPFQKNKYDTLLNESDVDKTKKEEKEEKKTKELEAKKIEKDPEVNETLADQNHTLKLQQEREKRRLSRESQSKNRTESTRKVEDAIDTLTDTMEEERRRKDLAEMQSKLEYSTKPTLKDFLKQQQESRRLRERPPQPSDVRRSLSSTGRLDQSQSLTNSKYAKAKPKICTRPSSSTTTQSARTHDDLKSPGDQSKQNFNDSYTMREATYNDWYHTKLTKAQKEIEDSRRKQKDEEERKVQEMISKKEKSDLVYDLWLIEKKKIEHKRKTEEKSKTKTKEEIEQEQYQKRKEGEKVIKDWLEKREETLREQKIKEDELKLKQEQAKRNKKLKQRGKSASKKGVEEKPPPAPITHEEWEKKKKKEISEKKRTEEQKEADKKRLEAEKEEKKERAKKSYLEWLEKKEKEEDSKAVASKTSLSKSLSSSMTSLPPFYPTSRTIPFGR